VGGVIERGRVGETAGPGVLRRREEIEVIRWAAGEGELSEGKEGRGGERTVAFAFRGCGGALGWGRGGKDERYGAKVKGEGVSRHVRQ